MYSDFQFSFCRAKAMLLLENLLKSCPKEVRLCFKGFPLEQIHDWSKAAMAGRCMFQQRTEDCVCRLLGRHDEAPKLEKAALPTRATMPTLEQITIDPEVMGGKPCIRGMRVTVEMIVGSMSAGRSIEDLLEDYPYLEIADIREALAFGAYLAQGHDIPLVS